MSLAAVKSNRCSNPSTNVRIIGRIRGLKSESLNKDSKPWITVKNPVENGSSNKCKVFFETQSTRRDGYELDYCYEQHEEIDRIYSREIQPLVLELFEGRNASVIALGAKGSGKTYTIQGSQEKPGLAVMEMSDILAKAKETGKSVSVSLYELTQELVKDLLYPDHPAIKVLDDAHGKVNIIGLSKVTVNSITEFHNMYFSQGCPQDTQKVAIDRSHQKGLMVHISFDDDKMKTKLANKINFVDLAGYEDLSKNSRQGNTPIGNTPIASNRKNKSLYALLNVITAISANETWVPYRESKPTRILQDSLCGGNRVLLLTCLNACFCQDTLSSISLVSCCRSIKQVLTMSASVNAKKPFGHSRLLSTAKDSRNLKERKLFDEVKKVRFKQAPQVIFTLECTSSVEQTEDSNSRAPGSQCMLKLENTPSATTDDPTILTKTVSNFVKIVGSSVVALGVFSNFNIHCDPGALEFESSVCSTDEVHSKVNITCGACNIHRYKTVSLKTLLTMMQNHDQENFRF